MLTSADSSEASVLDGNQCDNLFICWITTVSEGLRAGDIGAIMEVAWPGADTSQYAAVVAYQFSFYVFVITILLSVIFGMIVDTFSEICENEHTAKTHMEGVCFICGDGSGFDSISPSLWAASLRAWFTQV